MGSLGNAVIALVLLVALVGFAFAYPHLKLGSIFQIPTEQPAPLISSQQITPIAADRNNPISIEEFTIGHLGSVNSTNSHDLTLPQLFNKSDSSVIEITDVDQTNPSQSRLGSGFVYDDHGHIVTNYHVVSGTTPGGKISGTQPKQSLDVTFSDGTIYRATVIGSDPYADLAALYIEKVPKQELVPLSLANSSSLQVGEQVAAIGNPFGLSGSMTRGIVSGLGRLLPADSASSSPVFSIPNVIQTDAAINPGNSGGPLLNMKAEVVGVNSAIQSTTGEFSGIGFAIPADTIKKIIPLLITKGTYQHPYLGISGTNLTPDIASVVGLQEPRGFLVVSVVPGSPADKAGVHGGDKPTSLNGRTIALGGDIITALDGHKVRKIEDVLSYLEESKSVGDNLKMTVIRNGVIQDITVVLGSRPG